MKKHLLLRGAQVMLASARVHIGKNQRVNEWTDGKYMNVAIEAADCILQKAAWGVDAELAKEVKP